MAAGGIPMADAQAVVGVLRRLDELRDEIDEATQRNDLGAIERLRSEEAQLERYLRSCRGLGGIRPFTTDAERARQAVTRGVWTTVRRIERGDPELARHFRLYLRTGGSCIYDPGPEHAIAWQF
jgi:hypothetical protein